MKEHLSVELTRREWLRGVGAALAILAAPSVPLLSPFNSDEEADPVNQVLRHFFGDTTGANPFVARAAGEQGIKPVVLRAPIPAYIDIYGTLGLPLTFSGRVDYHEASQCRDYFKEHEAALRTRFDRFTDVRRAPVDRDIAYMVAGNLDLGGLRAAQGATQFQDKPAEALSDDDPAIILAASEMLGEHYDRTQKEVAQSLALTDKRPIVYESETVGTYYETPVSQVVHLRRPPRNSRAPRYPRGLLSARKKSDSQNLYPMYHAGLYV
jgi:hypothetical protein